MEAFDKGDLTAIMQRSASAKFDLACGYPSMKLPSWVLLEIEKVGAAELKKLANRGMPAESESRALHHQFTESLVRALGTPEALAAGAIVVPTGSLALDRCIAVLAANRTPVTLVPEIDIIGQMVSSHCGRKPLLIHHTLNGWPDLGDALMDFCRTHQDGAYLVVLSSPNNPTGACIPPDVLEHCAEWARRTGSALVLDQCFALLSSEDARAQFAFDLPTDFDWAVLWDSGKTIGLRHEKLGVVFASPRIRDAIETAVRQVSFDVSVRAKALFSSLLGAKHWPQYIQSTRQTIVANRKLLSTLTQTLRVDPAPHGSFGLILGIADEHRRTHHRILAEASVAVVPGWVFGGENSASSFLRVSLARQPTMFKQAALKLSRWLEARDLAA